jgi:hypothetical protein
MNKLPYEQWLDINYDELSIMFAETGADREMDFDFERDCEDIWFRDPSKYPNLIWNSDITGGAQ